MEIRRIFDPLVKRFRHKLRYYLRPRSTDEAEEVREIFAKIYMLSAFGLFLLATVYTGINNLDMKDNSPEDIVKRMKVDHPVTIKRFRLFTKVDEYQYDPKAPKTTEEKTETLETDKEEIV